MSRPYFLLYLPYVLSTIVGSTTPVSYWIAWVGSWFILWLTLSGGIKPLPQSKPWHQQLLRPLVVPQMIFAGFNALSSVFFFNFIQSAPFVRIDELQLSIQAQQFYVLGHAALAHALVFSSKEIKVHYTLQSKDWIKRLLLLSLIFLGFKVGLGFVPGLSQWVVKLQDLSLVSSAMLLAFSIPQKDLRGLIVAGILFGLNFYQALLSGYKEEILIPIVILGALLYPRYKLIVSTLAIPIAILLITILPLYVSVIRKIAWLGGVDSKDAASLAFSAIRSGNIQDSEKTNDEFLYFRISEISMFNKYQRSVPENRPFYEFTIVKQAFETLLPRFLYPNKLITELVVMERVYENNIIDRLSTVSAKPPLIVDGYLSFGAFGVWAFCFAIGLISSFAMQECERLFGGYLWGTCLMYTGLFQIFWRGNCLEFMLNTVFWSFVLMYVLFFIGRKTGWIVKAKPS